MDDAIDDDHERACRPADLYSAAPKCRDHETRDDSGKETLLRRNARGNAEGDRKRERHDADDESGGDVREKLFFGVVLEGGEEFRL